MFDQHQLRRHLVSFQNRNSLLLTTKITVKYTFPPSLLPEVDDRHKCHCMWQMQWYTYKWWSLTCCSFICIIAFLKFSLFLSVVVILGTVWVNYYMHAKQYSELHIALLGSMYTWGYYPQRFVKYTTILCSETFQLLCSKRLTMQTEYEITFICSVSD